MDNSSEQPHGAQSSHDEAQKHALNDEDSNTMEAGDAGRERQSSYREEIRLKWAELPRDELTPLWEQALDADADADAGADADRNPVIWFPYLKTKQTQTQTTMGALAVGGLTNPASNRVPPQTTRPVGAHTNPGWTTIEIGNGVSSITAHGRIDIL